MLASTELVELREQWRIAVVIGGGTFPRTRPCWFGENVPGIDPCEHGPRGVEGAHWIKRQRIERFLTAGALWVEDPDDPCGWYYEDDLIQLAAWDPRNGVPACAKHHARFDGHRVDAANELVIWRHEVPAHVEAFALDWGLETALEDRNPPIAGGI